MEETMKEIKAALKKHNAEMLVNSKIYILKEIRDILIRNDAKIEIDPEDPSFYIIIDDERIEVNCGVKAGLHTASSLQDNIDRIVDEI